jgi:RNA polymerase sigma factor (sigma-70 family)
MDASEFAAEIETHRRYLMRVAQLQLRDRDVAQDVVQDTIVAALSGAGGFDRRSSLKTWLTGILKHKIVDAIRRKKRAPVPLSATRGRSTISTRCSAPTGAGTPRPPTGAIRRPRSTSANSST